jgi:hypothetical protein
MYYIDHTEYAACEIMLEDHRKIHQHQHYKEQEKIPVSMSFNNMSTFDSGMTGAGVTGNLPPPENLPPPGQIS